MTFHCTALEPHPVSGVALAFYSSSQHTEKDISLFVSEHKTWVVLSAFSSQQMEGVSQTVSTAQHSLKYITEASAGRSTHEITHQYLCISAVTYSLHW